MSEFITLENVEMPFKFEVSIDDEDGSLCIENIYLFDEELSVKQMIALIDEFGVDDLNYELTEILKADSIAYC